MCEQGSNPFVIVNTDEYTTEKLSILKIIAEANYQVAKANLQLCHAISISNVEIKDCVFNCSGSDKNGITIMGNKK